MAEERCGRCRHWDKAERGYGVCRAPGHYWYGRRVHGQRKACATAYWRWWGFEREEAGR